METRIERSVSISKNITITFSHDIFPIKQLLIVAQYYCQKLSSYFHDAELGAVFRINFPVVLLYLRNEDHAIGRSNANSIPDVRASDLVET